MKTHVVTTTLQDTLSNALDLMDLYQVEGLPVVDADGQLCGILTEQDILGALLAEVALNTDDPTLLSALHRRATVGSLKVADVMTHTAISVPETSDVTEAALLLLRSGRKRLPVTNSEKRVVGTFNRIDVCQALFEGIL